MRLAIVIVIGFAVVAAAILVALAAWTARGIADIERRNPPLGRFADIGGVRVHYTDHPAGGTRLGPELPPLVFIHGASSNLSDAETVFAPRLEGRRRMVFFDRPGHGWSSRGDENRPEPQRQADVLAGLLDRLGIERAVIVGHSWGGSVAAAMAVLHPDRVAGLVFVAPATHPWPGGVAWYYRLTATPLLGEAFAWTLPYPLMHDRLDDAAAGAFEPEPMPTTYPVLARLALLLRPANFIANARDVDGLNAAVTALAPRYPEIDAPTVVVTGDADPVVRRDIHSDGLVRDISGAELVVVPGAGHMPHRTHPDVVIEAIETVTHRFFAQRPDLWHGQPGEL